MISVASAEKALLERYSPHRNGNFRTAFIGADRHKLQGEPDRTALAPVGYLVEQGPHRELRAHFHVANQFQVFVSGDGRIGGHRAEPGVGHFAGPYTAYGPIVGGDAGIGYMTLRNAWDDGAQFLPEKMEAFRPRRHERREVMFAPALVESATLKALRASVCTTLIVQQDDGLAAWSYAVPPNATVAGPPPSVGGGQYWLVMGGGMMNSAEGLLGHKSLVFVPPDEMPFVAQAGPDGLNVIAMQFPVFRRH